MVVSDIDLRLLRVFRAVVEAGGFSNAQALLNISQSTISTQMSQLETRLGFTLCHRGRSGFRLTEQGDQMYRQVVQLFQSLQQFQLQAEELKGGLCGHLRIGIIDSIITDPACPVSRVLAEFARKPNNAVRISLQVMAPQELETQLLDNRIDVAFGIFCSPLSGLTYKPLYQERDVLVCHRTHPLAALPQGSALTSEISRARKVIRTFLGTQELVPLDTDADTIFATVTNIEAAALLIQSGAYIGFLPEHYAQHWIDRGDMVALLPGQCTRHSDFSLVTRTHQSAPSRSLASFLQCVDSVLAKLDTPAADPHDNPRQTHFAPADVNIDPSLLNVR
ncbi:MULTISPECIES: LysR family transcriptional regulator [Silvimonas]|uniref:LysR family transcriptional regulator n=1 Tax=Silvimonas TaxID=300264 RepID=UPI0024B362E9|nr:MULTISPECIES: LysR family transcriptional regulator [Silvimonas]MDR3427287.1 LysR family transcriptional regulator [Silvimonas sp.]